MSDSPEPIPESYGALVPPSRRPPTAVGLLTPEPPSPEPVRRPAVRRGAWASVGRAVSAVLDVVDDAADAVARAVGGERR